MTNPEFSILIVNYNTSNYLSKCLNSIYKSDFPSSRFDNWIFDNASTDDSLKLAKKTGYKYTLISSSKNIGFARANNELVKKSKSPFVLFLNPDTLLSPETVSKMLDFMSRNPEVGAATCKVQLADGALDDACHRGFPTPWRALCHFSGISKLFSSSLLFNGYHLGYKNLDKVHSIDSCSGAFMMVNRKAGDDVGWFDDVFEWNGDDLDLCFRLWKKGWKVMYNPETLITHFRGISSGIKKHTKNQSSADSKTRRWATENRFKAMYLFHKKHLEKKYPFLINECVYLGIKLLRFTAYKGWI